MLQANGITYEIETPDGPLKLLDNVSFNVPRGHFMAVVGPSGCGKTTLLKAIAGMIAETGGRFFWNGHDLAEEDFEPSEIGFVPQFSIAYDQLSVDENVESAARLRCRFNSVDDLDDSIDNALEVTGMEGITDRDVKILSGGQKRRLALAMELVSNPRLLICDEVTSGLDPRSEHDIVFLLHEISRSEGRIVISVTHSLSHLDRYDSILVMHQGCVAYHGSPKTMLHYFGVSSLEEIYPKLQDREGPSWSRSWSKHRDSYYSRLEQEREKKILSGELPDPDAVRLAEAEKEGASGESGTEREKAVEENIPEVPGFFTQFFCLLGRRWRIFFRDRSQLVLQLVMVLLFPVLVAMFTDKGSGQIVGLSATQDVQTVQKDMEAQQLNMKTGSAVSGIIMFEVILLGLMGSNNAAREVAGERAVMEKEKYAGMRPSAYLASKLSYLSVLDVCLCGFFLGPWRRPDASAVPDFGERRHDFCMPGHFRPGPECGPGFPAEHLSGGFPASSLRSGAGASGICGGFHTALHFRVLGVVRQHLRPEGRRISRRQECAGYGPDALPGLLYCSGRACCVRHCGRLRGNPPFALGALI